MEWRDCAGVRLAGGRAVELAFEESGHGIVRGLVGSRPARRRHVPRAQLDEHFFPALRVSFDGGNPLGIDHHSRRPAAGAMTPRTVVIESDPRLMWGRDLGLDSRYGQNRHDGPHNARPNPAHRQAPRDYRKRQSNPLIEELRRYHGRMRLKYGLQPKGSPMRLLGATCAVIVLSGVLAAADSDERLIEAAKRGDAAAVRMLLQQRVPVDAVEADGSTALHQAARYDRIDIADLLIAAKADVKTATRYNITPLSLACANGNAALIDRLLKAGADPNSTSHEGQTALMTAALNGNVDAVKLLLIRGASVNVAEPNRGQTALMWAASEGNTAAAATLIESGADLKAKSKAGFTPLLFAVRGGHTETVQTLLARGASANDVAPDGTSALNMAVVNAYFELAR